MHGRLLPSLLAVLTMLVLGAGAAPATTTAPLGWTVSPAGTFKGVGGPVDPPLACMRSDIAGVFATSGNPFGTIDRVGYQNCTVGGFLTVTVTLVLPWSMSGISHQNGVTSISINRVAASISGPACTFTVAGQINASYDNATGVLTMRNQNTAVTYVNGCLGLVAQGQYVSILSDSYVINPRHVITPV